MTTLGSHCLIMAYAHVGHDSVIGDHCILANNATLAGHVVVEDYATIGAFSPVHQFCRVGRYAYIGGGTVVTQDVLPFSLTSATREAHAFGINKVGLQAPGIRCGTAPPFAPRLPSAAGGEDEHQPGAGETPRRSCRIRGYPLSGEFHRAIEAGNRAIKTAGPGTRSSEFLIDFCGKPKWLLSERCCWAHDSCRKVCK